MYKPTSNEDILIDLVEEYGLGVDINHSMGYIILELENGRKFRFDSEHDAILFIRNNMKWKPVDGTP
jgi:hypothetical protein